MKNLFNSIQMPKVGSNRFDLSHDVKMSFNMGQLAPTCVMDVVPGDIVRINVENMLRFAPLIAPVMHKVNVTTHYFFVPNRILWPEWEKWITGESDVEAPQMVPLTGSTEGSLYDYLGYPEIGDSSTYVSPFPVAAFAKIYDEYYRDQNLQTTELFEGLVAGIAAGNEWANNLAANPPPNRAWMHDYFTSALPFAQKGDAVTIPLINGDTAPVELRPIGDGFNGLVGLETVGGGLADAGALNLSGGAELQDSDNTQITFDPQGDLIVDLNTEAATINTLRRAFKLQEWLEKNARGGTRYIENILAHFGVRSSDARLQRPEYIGGAFQNMTISEVLSTAQTLDLDDNTNPIGQMAGHGISYGRGQQFKYRAEEHGWIIGIINVQPVTAYQQGLPRMFTRFDRLDHFWPSFANIGEQEVKVKEIWAAGTTAESEETFGYVPRYAEYKYMNSRVAGEFKSTLSFWHMGRIFASKPVLNASFIQSNPTTRVFAVESGVDTIYAHIFNNISAVRKMPKYGTPSF